MLNICIFFLHAFCYTYLYESINTKQTFFSLSVSFLFNERIWLFGPINSSLLTNEYTFIVL